jgi:hypothetical protein
VPRAAVESLDEQPLGEHRLGFRGALCVELARERADRLTPKLDHGRDVDDEVRLVHPGGREVDRLLGSVRGMPGLDLPQTRVVRGVGDEAPGPRVVGVAVVRDRRDHETRPMAPYYVHEHELVLARRLQAAVPEIERLSELRTEDLRRAFRLTPPRLRVSTSSHLAARKVHDPERPSAPLHLRERSPACHLDVVGMRRDREDVNRHGSSLRRILPPFRRRRS